MRDRRAAVISGGVSLGAYQAGFLEYYSRYQDWLLQTLEKSSNVTREDKSLPQHMSYYSGASAGSINALLLALRQCYRAENNVEDELFFKLWRDASLLTLLGDIGKSSKTTSEPDAMVGQKGIESLMKVIQEAWEAKTDEKWRACEVGFGATMTRLTPRQLSINDALQDRIGAVMPRMTEKFMVQISAANGVEPEIKPFLMYDAQNGAAPDMFPALAPSGGAPGSLSIHELMHLAQGSAAVPLIFPPAAVPHRIHSPKGETPITEESVRFVDGGILNNNPLDLIWFMHKRDLELHGTAQPSLENFRILYLDQDITGDRTIEVPGNGVKKGVMNSYGSLVSSLVTAGTSSQLVSTFEQVPGLRDQVEAPIHTRLLAGQHIFAMSALFDSSFLVYDYYQGMVTARAWLSARLETASDEPVEPPPAETSILDERTVVKDWLSEGPTSMADPNRPLISAVEAVDETFVSPRYTCLRDAALLDKRQSPESVPSCQALLKPEANAPGADRVSKGFAQQFQRQLENVTRQSKESPQDKEVREKQALERRLNHNLLALTRTLKRMELQFEGKRAPTFEDMMVGLEEDETALEKAPKDPQPTIKALPFRTLELKGIVSSLFPNEPLAPQYVVRTLRWYTDVALENYVALQPSWADKLILETVGDLFLNGYLGRLPDRRHLDLGLSTEGVELRAVNSIFNRHKFRGHLGLNVLTPKVFEDTAPVTDQTSDDQTSDDQTSNDQTSDPLQYYYRGDVGLAAGLTFYPLAGALPFGRLLGLMDYSALAITGRLMARTEVMYVSAGAISWVQKPRHSIYPQLELSLILLDRIEPFVRLRFRSLYPEVDPLSIPYYWGSKDPILQDLSLGVLIHF